jgi:hypothetical protein
VKLSITRRSALIGFGALASVPIVKGCGGSREGGSSDIGGGGGAGAPSSIAGSIWYALESSFTSDRSLMKVPNGGAGTPTKVASILRGDGIVDTYYPFISRKSTRYIQSGLHGQDSSATMIRIFDHATHQPYGFVDMRGFCAPRFMSPSGRYIGMIRSPDVVNNTRFSGFAIVDVNDINNVTSLRDEMPEGGEFVVGFDWLDDDRFIYINRDGVIFSGAAGTPGSADQRLGQLDLQGRRPGRFVVHPNGTTMLVVLGTQPSSSGRFDYDIYLYSVSGGTPIARMTSMDVCGEPAWSPDGSYFMFTFGFAGYSAPLGGQGGCSQFLASVSARELQFADGQRLDAAKVNCAQQNFWSSID